CALLRAERLAAIPRFLCLSPARAGLQTFRRPVPEIARAHPSGLAPPEISPPAGQRRRGPARHFQPPGPTGVRSPLSGHQDLKFNLLRGIGALFNLLRNLTG